MPDDSTGAAPRLVPGKTDQALSQELRQKLAPILEQVCAFVQEGRDKGLIISFNIAPDQFGRVRVASVDIVKPL